MQKKLMKSKFAPQVRHSNTYTLDHNPNKNLSISSTTTSNSQNKQKECKLLQDHKSNKEPQHDINDEMNNKPKPIVSVKKRNNTFLLGGSFNKKSIQDKSKDHLSYLLQNSDASSVSKSFMNKEKKNINDIKSSINKPEQAKISLKKKVSKGIGQRETKTVLKDFTRMISNIS